MKKISKIFAMALIALSVFCLASCGGNSGGGKQMAMLSKSITGMVMVLL